MSRRNCVKPHLTATNTLSYTYRNAGMIYSDSLLTMLDRFPPFLCRLIARNNGKGGTRKPLDNSEIARRSGLTVEKVASISKLPSWETVPVGICDRFRKACGITPRNEFRQIEYLRRSRDPARVLRPLAHLDNLERRKRARLKKLLSAFS